MRWHFGPCRVYAEDTVIFKDRTMHYEFLSSVLFPLLPYGLDDCDTTNQ